MMAKKTKIKGYKAFNQDWTCLDKRYACPGKFKEKGELAICGHGMHFCKKLADCFKYYPFDEYTKIAEVIAYGNVIEYEDKYCTDKLKIVREIPWSEVCSLLNMGIDNMGLNNIGNGNYGSGNVGHSNRGMYNTGHANTGDYNSGFWNIGNYNSGNYNNGLQNSGYYNNGNGNSGEWNKTDHSSGVLNTKEGTIYMFNKPSSWTYGDWMRSKERILMQRFRLHIIKHIPFNQMTDEEKQEHPEAAIIGSYMKISDATLQNQKMWDDTFSEEDKQKIMDMPNFDPDIFKEITGVDVVKKKKKNQKKKK